MPAPNPITVPFENSQPILNDSSRYLSCPVFFVAVLMMAIIGCGGHSQPNCGVAVSLFVAPPSAAADHTAAAPGNKASFVGGDNAPLGCPPTPGPIRLDLKWSVSDTVNTTIGNTPNVDYGVATCINATPSPVIVIATGTNFQGTTIRETATLTCR